ncbi:EI24 domain-containing protein [Hydrogenimonas sp. SS33]|uniref:EI24 domain-containing protein n=1 Tax=Hydrogenimonas leucolamina TaxID=2954236 RepID=UPI00336C273D
MQKINGYLIRSIRDILSWNVLRFAIFIGLPLMALWIWIGYELWEYAVAVTSMIISWIPFSIVKANGAEFIGFFIWFIMVLVSFAALTALIGPPILRTFKEKTYYLYTFTALMLLSVFWAWFMLIKWSYISAQLQKLLTELPFQTVADGIAWLFAFYLFYNGFILTLFLIISGFRKYFLEHIREKEYPHIPPISQRLRKSHHVRLVWDMLVFTVLSAIFFPLLFVPVANILVQLFLWGWLYRESYFLSTCTLYCKESDYLELRQHRLTIWSIALLTAMLNFLPVINIFAPFFAQIMFFHWIMEHRQAHQGHVVTAETMPQEKGEKEKNDEEQEDENA